MAFSLFGRPPGLALFCPRFIIIFWVQKEGQKEFDSLQVFG